ncbi:MAG: copper resistance protein B [Alphaproteobacteria bacterium]|nr:copper resistance protein B [Alphaproteobacteria bacterium]
MCDLVAVESLSTEGPWSALYRYVHGGHGHGNWLIVPYFFEVSATARVSDSGHCAAKLEGSTDWLITQRLILQPQIEMNFYSKDDAGRAIGAGLADLDTGLRLRYELTRNFAPYLAVTYSTTFGDTAEFTRHSGENVSGARFAIGIRARL